MLQQVVLNSASPMTLNIDSVDPDDIIVIKSISGLDPADVTLFTGDFARDGGYYQGRRSGRRNPVFNLKLNPDYANDVEVSDIREMLYTMFLEPGGDHGDGLQVVLKDDRKPDRYFVGYTEKLPSEIFAKETTAQVSMLCVDPFLKSVDETSDSDVAGWASLPVTYEGSARTGLLMNLKVSSATNQVIIDVDGQQMVIEGTFVAGDILVINTTIGERMIQLDGVDIMAGLTATSRWLQLRQGVNNFSVGGAALGDGKVALMSYSYRAAWWGI